MSKRVMVQAKNIRFPQQCALCMAPSTGTWENKRVIHQDGDNITVALQVPYCAMDLDGARFVSSREQLAFRGGLAVVALLGLYLLYFFDDMLSLQNVMIRFTIGPILGLGIWAGLSYLVVHKLAPMFANVRTQTIRKAVRIVEYHPPGLVLLDCDNVEFGEKTLAMNKKRGT